MVLSGSGTDGTFGARVVKANNGVVMAQRLDTAEHPSMPKPVIVRRIEQRMRLPGIKQYDEMYRYLQKDPGEYQVTGSQMLISVTDFTGLFLITVVPLRRQMRSGFNGLSFALPPYLNE